MTANVRRGQIFAVTQPVDQSGRLAQVGDQPAIRIVMDEALNVIEGHRQIQPRRLSQRHRSSGLRLNQCGNRRRTATSGNRRRSRKGHGITGLRLDRLYGSGNAGCRGIDGRGCGQVGGFQIGGGLSCCHGDVIDGRHGRCD